MPNSTAKPQTRVAEHSVTSQPDSGPLVAPATQRSILFFLSYPETTANDNHARLPAAFRAAGWQVATASHQSLRLNNGVLEYSAGPLTEFARFWLLGFGAATSFFDRMQLLLGLPEQRFVVSPSALLGLHGKFGQLQHSPDTYASSDMEFLLSKVSAGGRWVIKPTAGSNADGVQFVHDVAAAEAALKPLLANDRYALLQRYVPEVSQGELRVLCAAGRLVGHYLRVGKPGEVTNLSRGAQAQLVDLTSAQQQLAIRISQELLAQGVGYCAVDLVGDKLIETNIANPGGLGTLAELTGEDRASLVVQRLSAYWQLPAG